MQNSDVVVVCKSNLIYTLSKLCFVFHQVNSFTSGVSNSPHTPSQIQIIAPHRPDLAWNTWQQPLCGIGGASSLRSGRGEQAALGQMKTWQLRVVLHNPCSSPVMTIMCTPGSRAPNSASSYAHQYPHPKFPGHVLDTSVLYDPSCYWATAEKVRHPETEHCVSSYHHFLLTIYKSKTGSGISSTILVFQ